MSGTSDNKSYLSGTISALSPWSSRSATPKVDFEKKEDGAKPGEGSKSEATSSAQQGGDHSTRHAHRLRIKPYPNDCPPLNVLWYHAVDAPIRKPNYGAATPEPDKPPSPPKKWNAFSTNDSRALETAFQKMADQEEKLEHDRLSLDDTSGDVGISQSMDDDIQVTRGTRNHKSSRSIGNVGDDDVAGPKVPVNEDYLFDVDIKARELGPAYWLGPIYAVRRGTWFYVDGTILKPCDENLSYQLEEGYVKTKPWRSAQRSSSRPRRAASASTIAAQDHSVASSYKTEPNPAFEAAATDGKSEDETAINSQQQGPLLTQRLFGSYMNSVVTYQDESTAWLLSDDFISWMSSSVYQRFAGGAHRSGTKVVRGYQDLKKKALKDDKRSSIQSVEALEKPNPVEIRTRPVSPAVENVEGVANAGSSADALEPETRASFLERQMSNMVTSAWQDDPEQQDAEVRKREEKQIMEDYRDTPGDAQDREVDHLILITHGIGQRLGARFETFNFIHDVNELRKTLKTVYGESADLQALNGEVDKIEKNCRIQVLPVCWRHNLDFPKHSLKHNRKEFDLGDAGAEDDESYPTLEDITVDGVPALRNIIADLALDVLLYQTPAYKIHIADIVAKESNRLLRLFKRRNPNFDGKISLIGHSLGSAICFDLLSDQVRESPTIGKKTSKHQAKKDDGTKLHFDVDTFVCLGSPIGLFQMLNGKTIAGRGNPNQVTLDGSHETIEDPFSDSLPTSRSSTISSDPQNLDAIVSSPKCRQLFNIFHPSDPISYRIEPLISPSMTQLKPQPLPYTKRSFLGAPMGQGITGIPARVGQTFTGFWSSFSSGITTKFINSSLGISAEDAAKLGAPAIVPHNRLTQQSQKSVGAGTNITAGGVIPPDHIEQPRQSGADNAALAPEDDRKRKTAIAATSAEQAGMQPPTLIDNEIETLYNGFQKRRKSRQLEDGMNGKSVDMSEGGMGWKDAEAGRRLRREEAKVRLLNPNGRVDYSIQEGAFDISFLASIASHLAYWTDEDVCHFLLSQLLSRPRTPKK